MMDALTSAVSLCKRWEGFYRIVQERPLVMVGPYQCPARIWTIGYGSTRYADGRAVGPGDPPISEPEAQELLLAELQRSAVACRRLCSVLVDEPSDRLAALTSFVYNLGAGRLQASTLRLRVSQRNWPEAARELRRWVWAGGRKLPGLIARREDEARLLLAPVIQMAA